MRRIDQTCLKYGVRDVLELVRLANADDQKHMKAGTWDYIGDALHTSIMQDVKVIPRQEVTPDEDWRIQQLIWFWYHHAVSCAIYKRNDRKQALFFVVKALRHQSRISNHPNKITQLFYLLLTEKKEEAIKLASQIKDEVEKQTANELLAEWKE